MITTYINDLKTIAISDTHGKHRELNIPNCTILICCGDICTDGNKNEIIDFFDWFSEQPGNWKFYTPGNHDLMFELDPEAAKEIIPQYVTYLKNDSFKINENTFIHSYEMPEYLKLINSKATNILINHYPPLGYLDNNRGSEFQSSIINEHQFDKVIFGHEHQKYGRIIKENSELINCSSFNYITTPSIAQKIFRDKPEQWGFRGDMEMWNYLEEKMHKNFPNPNLDSALNLIKGLYNDLIHKKGKRQDRMVNFEQFGMSGGTISLDWWTEIGFPLLEKRILEIK